MERKLVPTYSKEHPEESALMKAIFKTIHDYEKFKGKKLEKIVLNRSKNTPKEGVPIFTGWEFEFVKAMEATKETKKNPEERIITTVGTFPVGDEGAGSDVEISAKGRYCDVLTLLFNNKESFVINGINCSEIFIEQMKYNLKRKYCEEEGNDNDCNFEYDCLKCDEKEE